MKLLILTQKIDINDDVLGFMHGWIAEFAKQCEKVTVVCLQKGECELPENVKVLPLGKESGRSRFKYLKRFYKYIWQERKNYDCIFAHMNPEYVVLGGWLWKLLNKKIGLWYAHGHVPFDLRIAEKFSNIIFTSTKSGCRLDSDKIKVVGQGIDTCRFQISDLRFQKNKNIFKIVTVGRISPIKDYETLIKAVKLLRRNKLFSRLQVDIIGAPAMLEDEKYLAELKKIAINKKLDNIINFVGSAPNNKIIGYLQKADLFVNMGKTGSLDKAILEAMACGLPILTCNESLLEILGGYKEKLMYLKNDFKDLAEKIDMINNMSAEEKKRIGKNLRIIVEKKHNLSGLIKKIISFY